MYNNNKKEVSVLIPVRNEENHIKTCVESIVNQDFPSNKLEVIFIDGNSTDNTRAIISTYIKTYSGLISLCDNPNKTVPFAMNIGIENSIGDYIVRLDAHSEYPNNYISECIKTIKSIEADNVGGLAFTKGKGILGSAFAKVLSSKFGVGNSGFRTNASSGYVDTVPFGAFKRETFEKYGFYDERLTRNQDYELNYRIRKNGGKIYLNSDIKFTYFCRDTLSGILNQSYENGKWNVITSRFCPGTMSLRHFIPLLFLLSLVSLPIIALYIPLFKWLFIAELGVYLLLDFIFSIRISHKFKENILLSLLFPIFHISYGFGSFMGLINGRSS